MKYTRIPPDPARYRYMSKADIEAAIADISNRMRGPMSNLERALSNADRADLRAALAEIGKE
jgi:hypothetical protein